MLCLYQYISIVKWSDEDHYHSLEITSILKEHAWCYIFPKDPVTSYDNVHHFCEKLGNTGVLPFTRWVQDWPRNSILTVLLGDLAANVMHGPMLLTLKTSTYNAYMNIHSHRTITSSPLLTLDLWVILNCVPTYFHSIPSTPNYSHALPSTPTHSHLLQFTHTYSHLLPRIFNQLPLIFSQLLPTLPTHTHFLCVLRVNRLYALIYLMYLINLRVYGLNIWSTVRSLRFTNVNVWKVNPFNVSKCFIFLVAPCESICSQAFVFHMPVSFTCLSWFSLRMIICYLSSCFCPSGKSELVRLGWKWMGMG